MQSNQSNTNKPTHPGSSDLSNAIPDVTECFLVRGNKNQHIQEILLGRKKQGLGAGKFVGIGGKVEPGETIIAATLREIHEEIGVHIIETDLQPVGVLTFLFPHKPQWSMRAYTYIAWHWQGEPIETREIEPMWVDVNAIPHAQMWGDTRFWMAHAFRGYRVDATFIFGEDNATVVDVQMQCAWPGLKSGDTQSPAHF